MLVSHSVVLVCFCFKNNLILFDRYSFCVRFFSDLAVFLFCIASGCNSDYQSFVQRFLTLSGVELFWVKYQPCSKIEK